MNSDELHEFYKEVVVGFLYKSYSNNQTKVICEKVQDFLEASGAAKATKKKTSESSYEDTHKVLNVVLSCFESGVENNLAGLLKKAIGNIALNSLQINKVYNFIKFLYFFILLRTQEQFLMENAQFQQLLKSYTT